MEIYTRYTTLGFYGVLCGVLCGMGFEGLIVRVNMNEMFERMDKYVVMIDMNE